LFGRKSESGAADGNDSSGSQSLFRSEEKSSSDKERSREEDQTQLCSNELVSLESADLLNVLLHPPPERLS